MKSTGAGAIHRRQPKSGPQNRGVGRGSQVLAKPPIYLMLGPHGARDPGELELVMAANRQFRVPRGIYLRRRAAQARPVRRAAVGGRHPHPHHPLDRAQPADRRLGDGYRDRISRWRSPWRRPAASASCIATSSRTSRPPRSARSRNSSPAWWSIRSPSIPSATLADALALMKENNISGDSGGGGRRQRSRPASSSAS